MPVFPLANYIFLSSSGMRPSKTSTSISRGAAAQKPFLEDLYVYEWKTAVRRKDNLSFHVLKCHRWGRRKYVLELAVQKVDPCQTYVWCETVLV